MTHQFSLLWKDLSFLPDDPVFKRLLSCFTCGLYSGNQKQSKTMTNSKGIIRSGELIAVMGPSGAGKSTFINCVTLGRNHIGFSGKIYVQGLPPGVPLRARNIVQQEMEQLIPCLTVSESLRYSSYFKNRNATKAEHEQYLEECMADLRLTDIRDNLIEKCSGGQRKRIAVGMELIAVQKPHFLFLDEPISGLDSDVGEMLVGILADRAARFGIAIVVTIHQPKQSVLDRFSRVFVFATGGDIVYNQSPRALPRYLAECRALITPGETPIDVAIQVASKPTESICLAMKSKADASLDPDDLLENNPHLPKRMLEDGLCSVEANFSFFTLLNLLRRTALITFMRQSRFNAIRLVLHAVVALVLISLYDREIGLDSGCIVIDPKLDPRNCSCGVTIDDLQKESVSSTNVKFQFFSLLFLMFASLMPTVLAFPSNIKLFLHEYRNGQYSTLTYYISKTLVEIPLQFAFPYAYCCFLYWYSQQPGLQNWKEIVFMSDRFQLFFFTTAFCCFIAQGLGFLIGILCVTSFNISIIVSSSALLFLFLFSGFFVRRNQMGDVATGITYFSFIRFGFESIIISIFGQDRCVLPKESSVMLTFSLNDADVNFNLILLGAHLIGIRLLALLVLQSKASKSLFRSFKRSTRRLLGKLGRLPCERGYGDPCGILKIIRCIMWVCVGLFMFQIFLGIIGGIIGVIIDATNGDAHNSTVINKTASAL